MMLKGELFSRVFKTNHGELLLYFEPDGHERGTLHQMMMLDGALRDNPVVGSYEQARTVFDNTCFLQAEEIALDIVVGVEAAAEPPRDYVMAEKMRPAPEGHDPFDDEILF